MRYGALLAFVITLLLPVGVVGAQEPHPSGPEAAYRAWSLRRAQAALVVAFEAEVSPGAVLRAWKDAPHEHQVAIVRAVEQVGKPYRFASRGPSAFDCSGLVDYAWRRTTDLPNRSSDQRDATERVEGEWLPGDVLYYPGHVMLAIGVDDLIVHAANRRTGVVIGEVSREVRAGRVLT
jgi:cell wall-associated NlpC family hydrolase